MQLVYNVRLDITLPRSTEKLLELNEGETIVIREGCQRRDHEVRRRARETVLHFSEECDGETHRLLSVEEVDMVPFVERTTTCHRLPCEVKTSSPDETGEEHGWVFKKKRSVYREQPIAAGWCEEGHEAHGGYHGMNVNNRDRAGAMSAKRRADEKNRLNSERHRQLAAVDIAGLEVCSIADSSPRPHHKTACRARAEQHNWIRRTATVYGRYSPTIVQAPKLVAQGWELLKSSCWVYLGYNFDVAKKKLRKFGVSENLENNYELAISSRTGGGGGVAERGSARPPPRRSGFNPRPGHSGYSHVGIVPDDAVGRRVLSGNSNFPPPPLRRCSILTSITLIGSQDLDVKSCPNLFTQFTHSRTESIWETHNYFCIYANKSYVTPAATSIPVTPLRGRGVLDRRTSPACLHSRCVDECEISPSSFPPTPPNPTTGVAPSEYELRHVWVTPLPLPRRQQQQPVLPTWRALSPDLRLRPEKVGSCGNNNTRSRAGPGQRPLGREVDGITRGQRTTLGPGGRGGRDIIVHRASCGNGEGGNGDPTGFRSGRPDTATAPCTARRGYLPGYHAPAINMAEWLASSPPTKATRIQSRILACGDRDGRYRWSACFLGDLPFLPPFHSGAAPFSRQSPSSALKTSLLRAAQMHSLTRHKISGCRSLVHVVFGPSWRTLAQSLPSTVTPDNQCAVYIGIFAHETVESSLQVIELPNFPGVYQWQKWVKCTIRIFMPTAGSEYLVLRRRVIDLLALCLRAGKFGKPLFGHAKLQRDTRGYRLFT
ncbi:hypothetical protein PR048_030163, partial [Dryococelus australis]